MQGKTISERENYLRALEFRYPEWIPITFDLMPSVWQRYGRQLEEVVLRHPLIWRLHPRQLCRPCRRAAYAGERIRAR